MSVGARVRAERERQSITQRRLAREAGLSEWTVCDLETGREPNPTLKTLRSVAEVLGVGVADLVLDGPELLDLEFRVAESVELGSLSTLEDRLKLAIADALPPDASARLSIWPWAEPADHRWPVIATPSSTVTLRAPASAVAALCEIAGRPLRIAEGLTLSAPVVRPVAPTETLRVLVQAPSPDAVANAVRQETTAAGCCPAVRVSGRRPLGSRSAWVAVLRGVPAAASALLQRLRVSGPERLFVPA